MMWKKHHLFYKRINIMFGNHEDLLNEIDIQSIENSISELKSERPDLNIVDRTISITDGIIMLLEITGQGGSHMLESQLEYRYGYIAISNAAPGLNDEGEEVVIENMLEYDGEDEYQRNALFQYFKSTVLNQVYLIRRLYSGNNNVIEQNSSVMENSTHIEPERQIAVSNARKKKDLPPLSHEKTKYPPLLKEQNNHSIHPDEDKELGYEDEIQDDEQSLREIENYNDTEETQYDGIPDDQEEPIIDDHVETVQQVPQQSYLRFDIQDIKNNRPRNKHYLIEDDDSDNQEGTLDIDDDFEYFSPIDAEDLDNEDATIITTDEDDSDLEYQPEYRKNASKGLFT